ncbi:MAG: NACHT domain-containing protein [Symploca sp. SIO2C1]|nr:NACHT domain-containing protein [Symploca sp. SIO2C1]
MSEKAKRKFGRSELHQRNVLWLLKALLLLAKGDLTLKDSQLETAVKVAWIAEETLKVTGEDKKKTRTGEKVVEGTTKQALWQLTENTDTPLKLPPRKRENSASTRESRQAEVVQNALYYLEELGVLQDERLKKNTKYWVFTLTLKHKDASLEENLGVVKQKLGWEISPSVKDAGVLASDFWQDCCHQQLPTDLSINPLLHGDGVVLTLDDIVPLELVERKQQPQHKDDFSPENFQRQASTEYEIPVEHGKFLTQVIETGEYLKNQNRKIAIIGEPGAGKTTLLQEIAKEVENAGSLPVFVRLADLEGKVLETYLLEDWLKEATRKRSISEDIQDEFVELFNLGRVWLLLDGVDEIAATSNLLSSLEKQLKGWISKTPIVLTCRLNVWDAGKNALYAFDKYRIQQLNPDLVGDFIHRFFSKAGEPTTGDQLIKKLERSQPRIRDLIKNPLRLTLLCRTWKRRQGELPQTKAELYKGFVETFYDWKDKPEIDKDKRQLLEQALGEMAKNALDKETTKFRLRESFVRQELDKFDKSLFDLACRVGWINKVGMAAENPDKAVYAFFHPTFQEYFAALAIDDWDFFLPSAHDNRNPKPGYCIFEPQWKEVILLWLGRENVEKKQKDIEKEQKEKFIKALVEFEDWCDKFYWYQAYFIAASGITEFVDCSLATTIVAQLLLWSFGFFNNQQKLPRQLTHTISQKARIVLRECERTTVIMGLNIMLSSSHQETQLQAAVRILLEYKQENFVAIATLNRLQENNCNNWTILASAVSLCEYFQYDLNNPYVAQAVTNLSRFLNKSEEDDLSYLFRSARSMVRGAFKYIYDIDIRQDEEYEPIKITTIFGKLEFSNLNIKSDNLEFNNYDSYCRTLQPYRDNEARNQLAIQLENKIGKLELEGSNTVNLSEVNALVELIEKSVPHSDLTSAWNIVSAVMNRMGEGKLGEIVFNHLEKIASDNLDIIDTLIQVVTKTLIQIVRDCIYLQPKFYSVAIDYLGKIGVGNSDTVDVLLEVIHSNSTQDTRIKAATVLNQVLRENLFHMAAIGLTKYLQKQTYVNNQPFYDACYSVIWHCAQNMTYPAFYQAWHQQEIKDITTNPNSQSLNQAHLP